MRVSRIRIQGFRKFQKPFELSLLGPAGRPLDTFVVAGANGGGKTTLLEALLLGLNHDELLMRDLSEQDRSTSAKRQMGPDATIEVELSDSDGRWTHRIQRRASGFTTRVADRVPASVAFDGGFNDPAEQCVVYTADPLARAHIPNIDVEYISSHRAPRLVGALQPPANGRPTENTERGRLERLKLSLIAQWSRRAYTPQLSHYDQWLAGLNAVWARLHPDGTKLALELLNPEDIDSTLQDLFLTGSTGRICSIDALSSGELEFLSVAGALIPRETPLSGLLLVDEPELHLHPEWQFRIVDVYRALAPQSQQIMATHADAPWDQVMSFERSFLGPADDPRATASATSAHGSAHEGLDP